MQFLVRLMKNMENNSELLTYEEVAQILKVTVSTINRYTKRKKNPLAVTYLSPENKKNPRISRTELDKFIQDNKNHELL